jgi:hypothetical protein
MIPDTGMTEVYEAPESIEATRRGANLLGSREWQSMHISRGCPPMVGIAPELSIHMDR